MRAVKLVLLPPLMSWLISSTNGKDDPLPLLQVRQAPGSSAVPLPNQVSPDSRVPCDPSNSVIDALTHRFRSDCGYTSWCQPIGSEIQSSSGNRSGQAISSSLPPSQTSAQIPPASSSSLATAAASASPPPNPSGIIPADHPQQSHPIPPASQNSANLQQAFAQSSPYPNHPSTSPYSFANQPSTEQPISHPNNMYFAKPQQFSAEPNNEGDEEEDDGQESEEEANFYRRDMEDEDEDTDFYTRDMEDLGLDSLDDFNDTAATDYEQSFHRQSQTPYSKESFQRQAELYRRQKYDDMEERDLIHDPEDDDDSVFSGTISSVKTDDGNKSGYCVPKGCRRDEFPFGYKGIPPDQIPPMCKEGTYCPDEESECKPFIPVGGQCQLNRDDSCAPMPFSSTTNNSTATLHPRATWTDWGFLNRRGMNTINETEKPLSRPMCLSGVCHIANVAVGQSCILDHTQYIGYDSDGKEVVETVTRDNCQDLLYCDETIMTCKQEKQAGETCQRDRECLEYNCNSKKVCDAPPEAPNSMPGWSFALIGVGIAILLASTVFILFRLHVSHRAARSDEIDRYFSEQWTYRQSILSMHAAALAAGVMPISSQSPFSKRTSQPPSYDAIRNGSLRRSQQSSGPTIGNANGSTDRCHLVFGPRPSQRSSSLDASHVLNQGATDATSTSYNINRTATASSNGGSSSSGAARKPTARLTSRRKPAPAE